MIKVADLKRAQSLAETIATKKRMMARLEAQEGVHLVLGSGGDASEIVLSTSYAGQIRDDVWRALRASVIEHEDELAALGVEP